jgi:hypothetical protein
MKNVRLFETTSAYESTKLDYPNLSLTQDDGKLYSNLVKPIEFVDLGLPSGTKWMKCNIGAEKETDYGLAFQFGDTVGCDESNAADHCDWLTCPGNGGDYEANTAALTEWNAENLTNGMLNNDVDAAYVYTNGQAKMPTQELVDELCYNTEASWIENFQGYEVNVAKFVNKKDSTKYIVIPANGYWFNGAFYRGSSWGLWLISADTNDVTKALLMWGQSSPYPTLNSQRTELCGVRGVKI